MEIDIKPRDYQSEALTALEAGRNEGSRRQLVALPTGSGKTIVAAFDIKEILETELGGALFIAHRDELIAQAADKIKRVWPEATIGRVKASDNELGRDVTVASVQTIYRDNRLQDVARQPYAVLYIDEAHHAAATTYRKIIDAVTRENPDIIVVGLTATPVRADATKLGDVFSSVTFHKSMIDLIESGHLSDIALKRIEMDVSLDKVRMSAGELKPSELRQVLVQHHVMDLMVDAWKEHASPRRTLTFCAGVDHARQLRDTFRAQGVSSEYLHGETPPDERQDILKRFQEGSFRVLANCQVLCLDSKTEILTSHGWTTMEEMSFSHEVANYDPYSGDVTFETPLDIVKRPRGLNERMVSIETTRRSIRVTEGHRMLYKTSTDKNAKWKKKAARDLIEKPLRLPVSTIADPIPQDVAQEPTLTDEQFRRRISASAYNLRKNNNYAYEASFAEAKARTIRRQSLKYAQPQELTLDECMFIGFWIGDGGVAKLQSGGVEYKLIQRHTLPKIITWVDNLLDNIGFDFVRRHKEFHISWSLPRGTGSGPQQRNGLYRLEPYLDKSLPECFWGLNEDQFDAMLYGLWMADGNHGKDGSIRKTRAGYRQMLIYQAGTTLLSRLQALAVCRGWRASLRGPDKRTNVYALSMTKRPDHVAASRHGLKMESSWLKEEVWCVRTRTSNLITRRKGSVTFMGNTEGFDDEATMVDGDWADPLECIMLAKPTLSQSLFIQMVGRGVRPGPGKENCLVLDFGYNTKRHHLVQLPHLFGYDPLPGVKKKEDEEEEERVPSKIPSILALVRAAKDVDAKAPPPRAGFRWSKSEFGFCLSIGSTHGYLAIRPVSDVDNEGFHVYHYAEPNYGRDGEERVRPKSDQYIEHKLTSAPMPFEWAFGLAEDSVRELLQARSKSTKSMTRETRVINRDATWHDQPPSEKQLGVLSREDRVPKTKGEAADMITAMIVTRIIKARVMATHKQLGYLRSRGIPHHKDHTTRAGASRLIGENKKNKEQDPDPLLVEGGEELFATEWHCKHCHRDLWFISERQSQRCLACGHKAVEVVDTEDEEKAV